jgi:hypothetical protein
LEERDKEIESVLFTDTAQIRSRFPYLASESLFLPTIIDIIKSKDLLSIFIDVKEKDSLSEALLAAADYRIFMTRKEDDYRFVGLNVDSVRGKDYDRHIREFEIKPDRRGKEYYLVFKKDEEENKENKKKVKNKATKKIKKSTKKVAKKKVAKKKKKK